MKMAENLGSNALEQGEPKRTGLLHKLMQVAEACDYDPQDELIRDVQALKRDIREIRAAVGLSNK